MAKSGVFKVWLVGIANPKKFNYNCYGDNAMYSIGIRLNQMFNRVCQHPGSQFISADYSWEMGHVQDTDVVVYCYFDQKYSVINKIGGMPKHATPSGATFSSPDGMITEIYLSTMDGAADFATLVANLIFHEIMHNKIDAANNQNIHITGGGGLAEANISRASLLSPGNIAQMAPALSKKVKQYTAGMQPPMV